MRIAIKLAVAVTITYCGGCYVSQTPICETSGYSQNVAGAHEGPMIRKDGGTSLHELPDHWVGAYIPLADGNGDVLMRFRRPFFTSSRSTEDGTLEAWLVRRAEYPGPELSPPGRSAWLSDEWRAAVLQTPAEQLAATQGVYPMSGRATVEMDDLATYTMRLDLATSRNVPLLQPGPIAGAAAGPQEPAPATVKLSLRRYRKTSIRRWDPFYFHP